MNAYKKLAEVQAELKAPKGQYNTFGKYNFRNCEDILEAVKPLLKNVNALLIVGDEIVQIADRYYIKATAQFIDCDTEIIIINTAYAREELERKGMDASQVTGSASSYARKYALNGLFCIDDVKDADSHDNSDKGKSAAAKAEDVEKKPGELIISGAMKSTFKTECERIGKTPAAILKALGVKSLETMTVDQFKLAMDNFEKTPSKPKPMIDPQKIPPDDADSGLPFN